MNIEKIKEHYDHAREKHPCFCNHMIPPTWNKESVRDNLNFIRDHLRIQSESNDIHWDTVLQCEVMEIVDAIVNRELSDAVEECYDAIAVILRIIDVLEGRQPLGNPERGDLCHEN